MHGATFLTFAALVLSSVTLVAAQGVGIIPPANEGSPAETSTPPATTSLLSECTTNCFEQALTSGGNCITSIELVCICGDQTFQTAANNCLQSSCTAEDVDTAVSLQSSRCDAITSSSIESTSVSNSVSGSQSTTVTSSSTRLVAGTSSVSSVSGSAAGTTSGSPTGLNAATAITQGLTGKAWLFNVGAMALCLVGGGFLVL